MRRGFGVGLVAAVLLAASVVAGAQSPVIRAHLAPGSGIIVGQAVRLTVEVLVPNYFTGAPDFPNFELENAIVVLPQDRPENMNDTIRGMTYAGIRQTYTIYPQQPGEFTLPPAEFTVPYANAPPEKTVGHVTLPPLKFRAEIPAAASGLSYFLPTTRLTMEQKWSVPVSKLRMGDTVERTITVTTVKMQGMLIPPLPMEAPEGLKVYPEEPKVLNQKTPHGDFVFGRRVESAKYFVEKEGEYTLPALELKWWNLETNRLATATIPAVHFTAAPNPDYVAELPPEPEPVVVQPPVQVSWWKRYRFWIRVVVPQVLAALAVLWLAWRFVPQGYRWVEARRELRRESEPTYFRNLVGAARRGDAGESYRLLLAWLRRSRPGSTVDAFLAESADPELTRQVNLLAARQYSGRSGGDWSGEEMARCLGRHRRAREESLRVLRRQRLPELNP
jgi:BatD DUF11 like domain